MEIKGNPATSKKQRQVVISSLKKYDACKSEIEIIEIINVGILELDLGNQKIEVRNVEGSDNIRLSECLCSEHPNSVNREIQTRNFMNLKTKLVDKKKPGNRTL